MGTFVSYAQNLEDVMLRRALADVQGGFYIDVGASSPVADSVTRTFYDAGWNGINIEPVQEAFEALTADRPLDVNLKVVLGAEPGTQELFLVDGGNGLSTTVDQYAEKHVEEGRKIDRVMVPCRTLADVCAEYAAEQIHFLKVDVEGAERSVLEGADFSRWRPWIVLVEATEPNSQAPTHAGWESLLTDASYVFVYFDGLNRFYLSEERHAELAGAFATPPNVFDEFVRYSHKAASDELNYLRERVAKSEAELDWCQQELFESSRWLGMMSKEVHNARQVMGQATAETRKLRREQNQLQKKVERLERQHAAIRRSTSWKLTRPLRVAARLAARGRGKQRALAMRVRKS